MTPDATERAVRLLEDLASLDFPMREDENLATRDSRIALWCCGCRGIGGGIGMVDSVLGLGGTLIRTAPACMPVARTS